MGISVKDIFGPYLPDAETKNMKQELEAILKVSRFKLLQIIRDAHANAELCARDSITWKDLDSALEDHQRASKYFRELELPDPKTAFDELRTHVAGKLDGIDVDAFVKDQRSEEELSEDVS